MVKQAQSWWGPQSAIALQWPDSCTALQERLRSVHRLGPNRHKLNTQAKNRRQHCSIGNTTIEASLFVLWPDSTAFRCSVHYLGAKTAQAKNPRQHRSIGNTTIVEASLFHLFFGVRGDDKSSFLRVNDFPFLTSQNQGPRTWTPNFLIKQQE